MIPTEFSVTGRIVTSAAMFLAMYGGVRLFLAAQRRRLRRKDASSERMTGVSTGTPRLLYFWTEECAPCRAQEREINLARKHLEISGVHLAFQKLNAHHEKLFTERYNVMTVPTTVLLDPEGRVVGWNPGLTRAQRLVDQVTKSLPSDAKQQAA